MNLTFECANVQSAIIFAQAEGDTTYGDIGPISISCGTGNTASTVKFLYRSSTKSPTTVSAHLLKYNWKITSLNGQATNEKTASTKHRVYTLYDKPKCYSDTCNLYGTFLQKGTWLKLVELATYGIGQYPSTISFQGRLTEAMYNSVWQNEPHYFLQHNFGQFTYNPAAARNTCDYVMAFGSHEWHILEYFDLVKVLNLFETEEQPELICFDAANLFTVLGRSIGFDFDPVAIKHKNGTNFAYDGPSLRLAAGSTCTESCYFDNHQISRDQQSNLRYDPTMYHLTNGYLIDLSENGYNSLVFGGNPELDYDDVFLILGDITGKPCE